MKISYVLFLLVYSLSLLICLVGDGHELLAPSRLAPHFFDILWDRAPIASKIFVALALVLPLICALQRTVYKKAWYIFSVYVLFFFAQDAVVGYLPRPYFQIVFAGLSGALLLYSIFAKPVLQTIPKTSFYIWAFPVVVMGMYLVLSGLSFASYPIYRSFDLMGRGGSFSHFRHLTDFDLMVRALKEVCIRILLLWGVVLPILLTYKKIYQTYQKNFSLKLMILTTLWVASFVASFFIFFSCFFFLKILLVLWCIFLILYSFWSVYEKKTRKTYKRSFREFLLFEEIDP